MQKPIIFLDYDGVVNTIQWRHYDRNPNHPRGEFRADFAMPEDGFVNNFQAICWLNETYLKRPFDIVVTSTWRKANNYKQCLYNGGLHKKIKIIGKTPWLNTYRGKEIQKWIKEHNFKGKFVILDDDADMGKLKNHLVQCNYEHGYGYSEMQQVVQLLRER